MQVVELRAGQPKLPMASKLSNLGAGTLDVKRLLNGPDRDSPLARTRRALRQVKESQSPPKAMHLKTVLPALESEREGRRAARSVLRNTSRTRVLATEGFGSIKPFKGRKASVIHGTKKQILGRP